MLTEMQLQQRAAESGYQQDVLEKVIRLLDLLDTLRSHPFLRQRIALKGGTALNLFLFDAPRLSVDIDLNYLGTSDRDGMIAERPGIEKAVSDVCGRLGIQVRHTPQDHAGGKWRLSYTTISGRPGALELDMNFMLRTPLWEVRAVDSHSVASFSATGIPMLDRHELAAGKLAALFSRNASRDLFDTRELLRVGGLDRRRLRTGFVVYGGINRRDWRTVSVEDIDANETDVDRQLLPMLRSSIAPARKDIGAWTRTLVDECRQLLSVVLPFEGPELEFLDRLNDHGRIAAELLTEDPRLQDIIRAHPALHWKALNVRHRTDER